MFTLVVVGVSVAYWYSVVITLVPHMMQLSHDTHGAGDVYFESAAVVTTLVLLGQYLELKARDVYKRQSQSHAKNVIAEMIKTTGTK